jgi:hypothetical protein
MLRRSSSSTRTGTLRTTFKPWIALIGSSFSFPHPTLILELTSTSPRSFGQRREVNVYRLIGAGTLEELIYNRQQYKRHLAATAYDATAERRMYTGVEGEGKANQGEVRFLPLLSFPSAFLPFPVPSAALGRQEHFQIQRERFPD